MRWLVLVIGLPVAIGLSAVSMMANWRFGVRLGAEDGDAFAYGLASVCADGLKIILPFAIGWAWSRRRVAEWLSAACLWLVISAYSLVSALSFAVVNRAEIADRKVTLSRQLTDLRAELDAKRLEHTRLPQARPVGAVEADLKTSEQNPRWQATRQCADAETREARQFCERHQRLAAELAVAKRGATLEEDLRKLAARIEAMPREAAARAVDPQLDLLKRLSGLGENTIKAALAILVCLLIELGSGLGLFVVLSCWRSLQPVGFSPIPSMGPVLDVAPMRGAEDKWAAERLMADPRAMMGAAEVYADYRLWMEAQAQDNLLTVTAFGRWMTDRGVVRDKVGGRVVYRGLRLLPTARLIAKA